MCQSHQESDPGSKDDDNGMETQERKLRTLYSTMDQGVSQRHGLHGPCSMVGTSKTLEIAQCLSVQDLIDVL